MPSSRCQKCMPGHTQEKPTPSSRDFMIFGQKNGRPDSRKMWLFRPPSNCPKISACIEKIYPQMVWNFPVDRVWGYGATCENVFKFSQKSEPTPPLKAENGCQGIHLRVMYARASICGKRMPGHPFFTCYPCSTGKTAHKRSRTNCRFLFSDM